MTICITPTDMDGGPDYHNAIPCQQHIDYINYLYNQGHEITYWTSRGAKTGIDWTELTAKQLEEWGCLHHHLRLDKPYYDKLIDDKAMALLEVI